MKDKSKKINVDYLKECIKKAGKKQTEVSKEMGYDSNYISSTFNSGTMNDTSLRFLCAVIGADYNAATAVKAPSKPSDTYELKEVAEIIVSYIQDVGKINSDVIRELREIRTQQLEQLQKMNKTLHELDVFLRNEGAENRQFHKTMNNYMQGISTCMRVK